MLDLLSRQAIPADLLRRAIGVRTLLGEALDHLEAEDGDLCRLLRLRFVGRQSVCHLEQHGWARSTLFRHQQQAITSLARILLEMAGPGAVLGCAADAPCAPAAFGSVGYLENVEARSHWENGPPAAWQAGRPYV